MYWRNNTIISVPALAYFDKKKETELNVNASSTGLGGIIMQEGEPAAYGSRTSNNCEQKYANIEGIVGDYMGSAKISHIHIWLQSNCGN